MNDLLEILEGIKESADTLNSRIEVAIKFIQLIIEEEKKHGSKKHSKHSSSL